MSNTRIVEQHATKYEKKIQGYHVIIFNGLLRVVTFKLIGLDNDLVQIPEELGKVSIVYLEIIPERNTPLTTQLPKSRAHTSSSPPREQHKTLPEPYEEG